MITFLTDGRKMLQTMLAFRYFPLPFQHRVGNWNVKEHLIMIVKNLIYLIYWYFSRLTNEKFWKNKNQINTLMFKRVEIQMLQRNDIKSRFYGDETCIWEIHFSFESKTRSESSVINSLLFALWTRASHKNRGFSSS